MRQGAYHRSRSSTGQRVTAEAGFTGKDIQDCLDMAELTDEEFDQFVKDNVDAVERADRAIMRKLLRRRHAAEGT